jgi:hypothetical protein
VAAIYEDATKLYNKMKKLDAVLAVFLEQAAASEEEPDLDAAHVHASRADDMFEHRKDIFKKLNSMKSTVKALSA